ncbi:MAG: glycosyltransferase family 2 protein [Thermoanaerobaculia bacterium]
MAKEQLSAVLVVRNEAAQIRQCLRALDLADEVLVVDTGSGDGTQDLAREHADRVLAFPSTGGGLPPLIHAAKNFAFAEARGPWILNLDADERLSDGLRAEIQRVLEAPDPRYAAYAVPFTHYFFGRYLRHGGFRGPLVRLFRKGKLRYPEDRAHSTPEVEGEIGRLEHLVVHFNHPRIDDFLRKMDLYTSQDAALTARHGRGGLRGRPARLPTRWSLVREPLGVFWNRYVRHRGFLDGAHGLVAAGLMAAYQFVESAKLWEALNPPAEEVG